MEDRGPREHEVLFGKIAVELGFITETHLQECIELQDTAIVQQGEDPVRRPIGALLLERGHLTYEQFQAVLREQNRRMAKSVRHTMLSRRDLLFGQLAMRHGLITAEQLNRALRRQAKMAEQGEPVRRIGEILVDLDWMRPEQVREILAVQNKRLLVCPKCGERFNAVGGPRREVYPCPVCAGPAVPVADDRVDASGTVDIDGPSRD